MESGLDIRGCRLFKGFLPRGDQAGMVEDVRDVIRAAPLFSPETRRGRRMSVRMTAAGRYGWYSDRKGYRYERRHPDGVPWPPIPASVADVWRRVTGLDATPDCCVVNHYREGARLGMHQDRDEADFSWPILSISLGDDALFRVGGVERGGPTESVWLSSGDVLLMGGAARLAHHGLDRIRPGTSTLLERFPDEFPEGRGRINLTLRVVD